MADGLKPRDAREVEQAVAWAAAEKRPLTVLGGGSKRAIGRPEQAEFTLDVSALGGITLYEPEELVLSARAGTPLAEIEAALAEKGQELAFEPGDLGPLFGGAPGKATIGGVIAANLSGPRRIKAGAARDHFLGVTAVSGRGETFKSGGRVVKNVTGYDLAKGLAGSWGTLAVMTDVTLKVLPAAETAASVVLTGLDADAAAKAMSAAMGSACDVSGAAHLPGPVAARSAVETVRGGGGSLTALRLEGFGPSVASRVKNLKDVLRPFGAAGQLGEDDTRWLWREVRDVNCFAAEPDRPLWRLSVPPLEGAKVAARILEQADGQCLFDWAGGLVWLELAASEDAGEAIVRAALADTGGHATLIRAEPAVRAAVAVFQPQPAPLAALTRRLKESFDPAGILNPGRMWAGV
jgi:glycolate oxidase FAD binding subunit